MFRMEEGKVADMSKQEKIKQISIFYHTLKHILSHPKAKHCYGKFVIHWVLFYRLLNIATDNLVKYPLSVIQCSQSKKTILSIT